MHSERSSGILLHPTSLPGPHGSGDFGAAAYHFVDWLVAAGQKMWQMLPLCPPGMASSPYMGLSAFAGSPLLIDLNELVSRGWLSQKELASVPNFPKGKIDFPAVTVFRMDTLRKASDTFFTQDDSASVHEYEKFCREQKNWLEDYALFMALMKKYDNKEWSTWDTDIVHRKPAALKSARKELHTEIQFWEFVQWCFFRQWFALKKYANERGVKMFGDIPIFIAYQSADAWAQPHLFFLDTAMRPTVVAGVPPDYFSVTGQRWGNPLYRWNVMEKEHYSWWIERIKTTLLLFDLVRIDHFRGFAAYWEIPATEKTAEHGKWVHGPKDKLFAAIKKKLGKLPIIAEDLGLMTPDVYELRDKFEFPGMRILQFAFAGDSNNTFLPHNYEKNTVVYTGTHDNDTTLGWFTAATEREKAYAKKYIGADGKDIHKYLMRAASQSVAAMAVFPFQDVLGLGTEHRMNLPGTSTGNWQWRFEWSQVEHGHAAWLYELSAVNGRCAADKVQLPPYPDGKQTP